MNSQQKLSEVLAFRVSPALLGGIDAEAQALGLRRQDLVRMALAEKVRHWTHQHTQEEEERGSEEINPR